MSTLLAERLLQTPPNSPQHKRALARLLSHAENQHPHSPAELSHLYPHTGQAHLIGVTGAPGTGKSSLVTALLTVFRQQEKRVAVLAVDPSSPFSGGALLGDRIRMRAFSQDDGVFIRSMASRGRLGGLAETTSAAVDVLDAAGFDLIVIETVGAGQSEVDIARLAQSVVVVEAPGLGDGVQAIKAGILEIADLLVVNKADHPDADKSVRTLQSMLHLGETQSPPRLTDSQLGRLLNQNALPPPASELRWQVPVLKTIAPSGQGVETLAEMLAQHQRYLQESGLDQQREQARRLATVENLLKTALLEQALQKLSPADLQNLNQALTAKSLPPHEAVARLLGLG